MKAIANWLLISSFVFYFSCSENIEKGKSSGAITIPVFKLAKTNTKMPRIYTGNVHAIKNVEINARVKGYLEQVYIDEGQFVKKGQALFRINADEYNSDLAKAKALLSQSIAESKEMELQVEKLRQLVSKQVMSKTELDVAMARLEAAKAKVEEAQSNVSNSILKLNHTRINAPFTGIIDGVPYKLGSLIDEGTELTNLSDIHEVYVYFNVSEKEYLRYIKSTNRHSGDEIELILADGTVFPHRGKVETMEGQFDETTGSIAFRAKFPNPNNVLKHGSTGTLRLSALLPDAIVIPHKATFEIQDKNFVYVVDKNNKVHMRSFVPQYRINNAYVVESGLTEDETVVYEGIQSLKDGIKINPKLIDLNESNSQTIKSN